MVDKKIEEKKQNTKAKIAKFAKPAKIEKTEGKSFAIDIAQKFGVSTFDFLILKRQNGIEDTTPITVSEFKAMYQQLIEGR